MNSKYTNFLRDIQDFQNKLEIIPGSYENPIGSAYRKPHNVCINFKDGTTQIRHYECRQYKITINDSGYAEFSFGNRQWLLHRAIAEISFGEEFYNNEEVNHKDGNKLNNRVSNLECVSHDENVDHALKADLITSFPVLDLTTGIVYPSAGAVDRAFGKYIGHTVNKLLHDSIVENHNMILILTYDKFEKYKSQLYKYHKVMVETSNGRYIQNIV